MDIAHMPTKQPEFISVELGKIKSWGQNPRDISKERLESLAQSIVKYGMFKTLTCWMEGDSYVTGGGNMRFRAMKEILRWPDDKKIQISVNFPSNEAEKIELALLDNQNFGFYNELAAEELISPVMSDIDTGLIELPFEPTIIQASDDISLGGDLRKSEEEEEGYDFLGDSEERLGGSAVHDLRQAVQFQGAGRFDIPALLDNMLLETNTPKCWAGPRATERWDGNYLYNYGSDSMVDLPMERTVVSFYVDDHRFEKIWTDAKKVAVKFLNQKILGIVSPNFSTFFSWPRAVRLFNVYRSRWVARFMQEAGIRIIPDLAGALADKEFAFDGIPKGSPVAAQAHRTMKDKSALMEKNGFLEEAFKTIEPRKIWIYATEENAKQLPVLRGTPHEIIVPRQVLQKAYRLKVSKK